MPCYHPLQAYYDGLLPSGKRRIRFHSKKVKESGTGLNKTECELPCGQCIGCRLERSRQWAARCVCEAKMYDRNCFITLTFSEEALAKRSFPMSLDVLDFQLFMKRFRKRFGNGIRFFHCGEYGDLRKRPHYHACIFNFDFPDRKLFTVRNGIKLYTSDILSELWTYGHCTVGDVTFESAAYVARYITKKITGKAAKEHYLHIDLDTGECFDRKPEYTTMSRRPGIGNAWFRKFTNDVFPCDNLVLRDFPMKPPKYFSGLYEIDNPEEFQSIKAKRIASAERVSSDNTYARRVVREKVHLAKMRMLVRDLE